MRVANWQIALLEVFEAAQGRRFRWGQHDCCQFAARCVEAITGEDKRDMFQRYQTRAEAEAMLTHFGGMRALLTRGFGEPMQNKSLATMGDIVLIDMGMGLQPAVCMGLDSFAPGMRNLQHRKTLMALDAWTI